MTTGAGFAMCNMKVNLGRGVNEKWKELLREADKAAQLIKAQTQEVSKVGKDIHELKTSTEGLPEIKKTLLACSELIDEVSTKAVDVEKLATLLEVEKHRSQHLQRLTALHRQVKKHVADNIESTTSYENDLKEKYFENKKSERMAAISRVRRNTHTTASSEGTPSRSGSHPPRQDSTGPANSSIVSNTVAEPAVDNDTTKCTFCTYPIEDDEFNCSMCEEPIPGREKPAAVPDDGEQKDDTNDKSNDSDDKQLEVQTPSQQSSSSHTDTVKSITNTTTPSTEGVLVESPNDNSS
eukprot:TRINITY_DN7076_c0_g2_i1.p1 TRINITY_DN7076_c0_g2~~TRINITY_DN7076_c0_g2_i1.p1  ORF type:complete len:295 (+),score=63.05 TRINITY_DN7076_c0_g2_i1:247-1131(+)